MATLQMTIDVKKVVTKVTGKELGTVFNDKRKSFERRYKFKGLMDVSPKQIRKIHKKISKKYPEHQFVVKNATVNPGEQRWVTQWKGLTISVF